MMKNIKLILEASRNKACDENVKNDQDDQVDIKTSRCKDCDKGKCAQKGTFFANRFPSLRNFVNKKLEMEKTKRTFVTSVFKVRWAYFFRNPTFLLTKFPRDGKCVREKNTYLLM